MHCRGHVGSGGDRGGVCVVGGVLVQGVTEVAGESASGKTQLCLQLCLTVQLPVRMGGLAAGITSILASSSPQTPSLL